jgi:diguanylate cyclase (GGDEF)-like protein/PAS domain S-box-containing protein
VARDWALAACATADVSLSFDELVGELTRLLDVLADCLVSEPFDARPAIAVGEGLVTWNIVGDDAVRRSMALMGHALTGDHPAPIDRVHALLGAVAAGYGRALQERTLVTQEVISRALLRAKDEIERILQASEERFREVFAAAAVGILISGLDGRVIQYNAAFRDMLGHPDADLAGREVLDLFDPAGIPAVRECYDDVRDGVVRRSRGPAQLVGSDGEIVWTLLSISLLRDSDGQPLHYLTMVDNVSDLHLLAENVSRQGLYDVLTALPNRQFLINRLTELVGRPESPSMVTLCHIDLDSLGLINNGLGRAAGDLMLRVVAGRLRQAFTDTGAILARIGGDEFAVLVVREDPQGDLDLFDLIRNINQALADPVQIGEQRVAVSASIGVTRRRSVEASAEELLREAETTVWRLKSRDKVQWGMFDEHRDAVDRERARLVAALPEALASGEIEPVFQPLVRLEGNAVVAVEARVEWNSPELGVRDHDQCVALAEETTLALTLGGWLLDVASRQVRRWADELGADAPVMVVNLTDRQANDPDLISVVTSVIEDSGVDLASLWLGMPVAEVARSGSDAEDNVRVLEELGVPTVLHGVGADDLYLLDSGLKVRGVVLDDAVLRRLGPHPDVTSLSAMFLTRLVPLVRSRRLIVAVRGVSTSEQVRWLREVGVDLGQGPYFGREYCPARSSVGTERSH